MRCQVLAVFGLLGAAAAKPCKSVYPSSLSAVETNTAVSVVSSSSTASADSASASGSAAASGSASASGSGSASGSASASGSVSADASASSAADVSSILSSLVASSTVSVASDASYTVSSDAVSSTASAIASDYSSGAASSDASSISVAASTDVSSAASSAASDVSSAAASSDASSAASSISIAASSDVSSVAASSDASSVVPSSTVASSTESAASSSASASSTAAVTVESVDSTVLIIARDEEGASSGASGLVGYGIQFEKLLIPQAGGAIPTLSSGGKGNYAAIIIVDAVAYQYTDGWRSAITTEQWDTIHKYQTDFHVRMVRINEYPGPAFGATVAGDGQGCCGAGVEQLVSFTDVSDFPTANLKTGEGITTQGLFHYPASITDTATTKAVAKFGPGGTYTTDTVAAVINNFEGREQFVWFTSWAPTWSATSNYLQHAHIHWMTRGVFLGKRKIHLSAQIDDVQLETELFYPAGQIFKISTADLEGHVAWQKDLNSRLPEGSDFWLEFAHNGNGDIEAATTPDGSNGVCNPDYAVWYDEAPDTPLEFKKVPGTGVDQWPVEFQEYGWSLTCAQRDPFAVWFQNPENLNAFGHLSHTFTHLALNNATYKDAEREIQFNQAWFKQMGIDKAARWSANGLVPPAITGLHNADVINAWLANGIKNVVGDNTRPVLRSTESQFWPLISTVERNGADGLTIVPRYATTIYFNCDTAECTTREWIQTSGGSGDFQNLLAQAKSENTRYLFGLHADPYMFHQANMRQADQPEITVGNKSGKFSIVSAWVEVVAQEMTRLTNWPITTLKHDDIAKYFTDRMALDKCKPTLSFGYAADGKSITSVTVGANGNTCSVPVPVTIPSGSLSGGSVVADQVGTEPPIQWVTLSGSPVTLSLSSAVAVAA